MSPYASRDQAYTDALILSKMIHKPPSSWKGLIQNPPKKSSGMFEVTMRDFHIRQWWLYVNSESGVRALDPDYTWTASVLK